MPRTSDPLHLAVLLALCACDLAFIVLHLASLAAPEIFPAWRLSIETDGAMPEQFQYLKWTTLAVALAVAAARTRSIGLLAWSALFAYLLADDALGLHERAGGLLAQKLNLPPMPPLRAQDAGELLYLSLVGGCLLLLLAAAWRRGGPAMRAVTADLAALLATLVVFGVGIDMAHVAASPWPILKHGFGILEDGGEMVCASLMVAYALTLTRLASPPAFGPWPVPRIPFAWPGLHNLKSSALQHFWLLLRRQG